MVALNSPQAKHIKHLTNTEKIEAMHRSLNDPANEQQFEHLLTMSSKNIKDFITNVNAGKFTIGKWSSRDDHGIDNDEDGDIDFI